MNARLIAVLLLAALAAVAWPQEPPAGAGQAASADEAQTALPEEGEPEAAADEDAEDAADVDDSDLDVQTYEQDDDDFVPTQEIPADEPIPFPSNI